MSTAAGFGSAERSPIRVGDVLGGFRLEREIARGGMGAVYEVSSPEGGRFALKTILLEGLGLDEDDEFLLRFRREGELLARLDHMHIVRVHAAEFGGPVPYMVQDLLPGGSLHDRLRRGGPLPEAEAIQLVIKLAQALDHAHGRGVVHRDLKPENVMFDDMGQPRLVDFGIGLSMDAQASRLSMTGQMLGTPGFMAPEQALGEKSTDERTDVYGLGAVLYSSLTGRPPFNEKSALLTLESVVNSPPPDPRALDPDISPATSAVCQRALAKAPGDRYPSTRALAEALATGRAGTTPLGLGKALALIFAAAALVGGALYALTREEAAAPDPVVVPEPTEPLQQKPRPAWELQAHTRSVGQFQRTASSGKTILTHLKMDLAQEVGELRQPQSIRFRIEQMRMFRKVPPPLSDIMVDSYQGPIDPLQSGGWLAPAIGGELDVRFDRNTGAVLEVSGLNELREREIMPRLRDSLMLARKAVDEDPRLLKIRRSFSDERLRANLGLLFTTIPPGNDLRANLRWSGKAKSALPDLEGPLHLELSYTTSGDGVVHFQDEDHHAPTELKNYSLRGEAEYEGGSLVRAKVVETYELRAGGQLRPYRAELLYDLIEPPTSTRPGDGR